MLPDYGIILLFLFLGIAFVASAFVVSWVLRPREPNPIKESTYECGEVVKGSSRVQFNVRYYLIALIFVIFDVEIIFLAPWAVIFRELGVTAYIEMVVFVLLLIFGLIYAWKKGALEWQ
ncbi:MAG: NADH-quinone oxidoreductase subunit A [Candidatus Omnitrophota bacterium]|nr:NADH-quinone oxidoreductase subunit A [Candidatus Omnitrophota bacterium]